MAMANEPLLQMLARLHPLASLGAASLRGLLPLCNHERVTRSLNPFGRRDWHGQVVYLTKGELKIDQPDGSTVLYVGGFGDALMPLSVDGETPTSAKAITDVELLRFHEDTLDIVVTWDQAAPPAGASEGGEATDWRAKSGIFAAQNFVDGVFAALPPANIEDRKSVV